MIFFVFIVVHINEKRGKQYGFKDNNRKQNRYTHRGGINLPLFFCPLSVVIFTRQIFPNALEKQLKKKRNKLYSKKYNLENFVKNPITSILIGFYLLPLLFLLGVFFPNSLQICGLF